MPWKLSKRNSKQKDTRDEIVALNARSVLLGCKYTIIQMLKQVTHQSGDRSWIIHMAFVAGVVGVPTSNFSASQGIGRTDANCGVFLIPCSFSSSGIVVSETRQAAIDYTL